MPASSKNTKLLKWITVVIFVACLIAGVALRCQSLQDPVWVDELHTAWTVSGQFHEVAQRAALGNQSPLYFWLVHPVHQVCGQNEFSLRLVSLTSSILLLLTIPWVVHRLTGSLLSGCLSVALAAFDDQFLFYAVEARPYASVQLIVVWQFFFFLSGFFGPFQRDSADTSARHAVGWWCVLSW